MLYVVNYADGKPYESYRKINSRTAKWFGKADKVIEYSSKDIPQSYKDAHKEIFSYKRGAGLWLWKPYIINDALAKINNGDWLFYIDSGATVIRDLHHIIDNAEFNGQEIFLMEQPLLSRQFTKRECYIKMGIEEHGENQVLAQVFIKKSAFSILFIKEWLKLCEDEELLSPKVFHPEVEEFPDFYAHREDQALLNLLRIKYSIPINRDCSDYGEMPFMYANKPEFIFSPKEYLNSNYPTIILANRREHPYIYGVKYLIKHFLNKLGVIYTEERFIKKYHTRKD